MKLCDGSSLCYSQALPCFPELSIDFIQRITSGVLQGLELNADSSTLLIQGLKIASKVRAIFRLFLSCLSL